MTCNLTCVLRWTIYVLAVLTIILAIATIVMDQSDNSNEKDAAGEGTGRPYTSKTGSNVGLFLLMLATAAFAAFHYFWRRLVFILVMAILGVIFLILRLCMPHKVHFETTFVVPLNNAIAIFYIYWVGIYKTDKEESFCQALIKNDVQTGDSTHSQKKSKLKQEVKKSKDSRDSKNTKKVSTKGTKIGN